MRSDTEFRSELRSFVERKAKGIPVDDRTPLFADRILRSVHLPELILLLERLRGAPVDVERLQPGDVGCIDVMVQRFWETP
jgi:hypothetical protein